MKLEFDYKGDAVHLSVVGYEFETAELDDPEDPYDLNWLYVEVSHFSGGTKKIMREPALLSWELQDIRDYFSDCNQKPILEFMEPEITFLCDVKDISLELRYGLRLNDKEDVNILRSQSGDEWIDHSRRVLNKMCSEFPGRGPRPF